MALAVARITLLVTTDRITLPIRRWVVKRFGDESNMAYLVHCRRCTSIWVAMPAAITWALLALPLNLWWLALPAWPALSYVAVLLGRLEDQE